MVYIDEPKIEWRGRLWSHMTADDEHELHDFAFSLGLKREWFQDKRLPHYDTVFFKQAVKFGAKVVHGREIVQRAKALRARMDVAAITEYQIECLRVELAVVRFIVLTEWTGGEGGPSIEELLRVIPR